MLRTLMVLAVMMACFAVATPAWSQDFGTFPDHPGVTPATLPTFPLGPGFYLNWLKILACWLVFLMWVRTVDWISRDGQELKLDYRRWNTIAFSSFIVAYILLWIIPIFWIDFPLLAIAYIVPLVVYVKHRNSTVTIDEAVFTRPHLRYWLSQRLRVIGIKMAAEPPGKHGKVPRVDLDARGADARQNAANLLLAKQSPGFPEAQVLVADVAARRADAVLFNFTQESVATRYLIDGVWHDVEPRDRPTGDALLAVLKAISALNPEQRMARQQGSFGAVYEKVKYSCKLTSQGTPTGERVLLQFDSSRMKGKRLVDLDMRQKMLEDFKAVLETHGGVIVISTPPAGGLTTLFSATVASMDRFMRSFVAVESTALRGNGRGERSGDDVRRTGRRVTHHRIAEARPRASRRVRRSRFREWRERCFSLQPGDRAKTHGGHVDPRQGGLGSAAAHSDVEGAGRAVRRGGGRIAQFALDPQAVREVQGGLCSAAAGARTIGHPRGTHRSLLSPAATARRGLYAVRGNRLRGPHGAVRIVDRRRRRAAGLGPHSTVDRLSARRRGGPACARCRKRASYWWPRA